MNSARLLSPILFVAAAGCLAKDAPLCRIEETVWDSGKGGWHTYAALEVRPDKSCIWTVDPPATWSDLFRTGSFQLEGAEYQELLLVLESDAFSKSGAVPTHRVFIDDHRARVPSAVAAVLDRFRKANWTSVVHWFPSPEIPVDLFKRDQPLIGDLILWGGGIIVRADRFYSLDLDRATTTALVIPGMESIGALAMRGASEEVALGRDGGGGAVLRARGASGWKNLTLPDVVRTSSKSYLLSAEGDSIVLFGQGRCFRIRGEGPPAEIRLKPNLPEKFKLMGYDEPQRCLLQDGVLFLAHDHGEWGGALFSVDLTSGDWTVVSDQLPVRELRVDPKGKLWAVEGVNHLGHQAGILRIREGKTWSEFASVSSYDTEKKKLRNWNLPVSPLNSVSFDSKGTPYVLAEYEGVARWQEGRWELVTRGWPRYFFNGDPYLVASDALQIVRDCFAVVSMGDAGIAVWDLKSGRITRVTLKE